MPWSNTGATHYHAQLGLQNKGFAIKKCWLSVMCHLIDISMLLYIKHQYTNMLLFEWQKSWLNESLP